MRFSVTHPLSAGSTDPALVTGAGLAGLAAEAESAGFGAMGVTDHPAPPQRWLEAGGHDTLDPFVALSFVAAATQDLLLIPNILVLGYRNPFLVAKAAASLDVLSGGRFVLAAGTGYLRSEFRALGVDPDERNERFDEALEVVVAAWTTDEVAHQGTSFSAREVTAHPRPIQSPHPPVWIGGNSARARQRVAEGGQGWVPFRAPANLAATARTAPLATVEDLAERLGDLWARVRAGGRDPAGIDVTFACDAGGDPADDDFDADMHLAGLDRLAELGVTWIQVPVPGDDADRAVATLRRYGTEVIARWR